MKNLILTALILLSGGLCQAQGNLADMTSQSVVFILKIKASNSSLNQIIEKCILPEFKKLKQQSFSEEKMHFLVKDISLPLKLLTIFANREIADFDILVQLNLNLELTHEQLQALASMKAYLETVSSRLILFKSQNFPFYRAEDSKVTDVAMAFINQWHSELSPGQAQDYWLNHHGPLVMKTGLPAVVKSYTQIHTSLNEDATLFDTQIQGLSFETISSQKSLVSFFLTHPEMQKLNKTLIKDELNFTKPALMFVFRTLAL
jgi:hypothetical protein